MAIDVQDTLKIGEAAEFLQVSRARVYRLIKNGKLPVVTRVETGRTIQAIPRDALEERLAEMREREEFSSASMSAEYVSLGEAAELLDCHISRVSHLISEGKLEAIRVHRNLCAVFRPSVEAELERRRASN